MTLPEPTAPPMPFEGKRLSLFLLLLLLELALFFAGLLVPASASVRQALANQTSAQFSPAVNGTAAALAGFIFFHNLSIAAFEMVPVAGAFLFVFSVYSTGLAAQALVSSQGLQPQWGAIIFAFPYSLVELSAYALAVLAGTMLLMAWRRKTLRREIRTFVLEGIAVAGILIVAATMESITVKVSFLVGFALWLPTGLALGAAILLARRRSF